MHYVLYVLLVMILLFTKTSIRTENLHAIETIPTTRTLATILIDFKFNGMHALVEISITIIITRYDYFMDIFINERGFAKVESEKPIIHILQRLLIVFIMIKLVVTQTIVTYSILYTYLKLDNYCILDTFVNSIRDFIIKIINNCIDKSSCSYNWKYQILYSPITDVKVP